MNAESLVAGLSIKILTNFVYDLLKRAQGTPARPIDIAIKNTVERFPGIEGLKLTLEQWLLSPGVVAVLEEFAKGLRGFDPIKIDALSVKLIRNTQFFLLEGADAAAHEIVSWFLAQMREQYLMVPELGIPHIANRVEDAIKVNAAGFDALRSDLKEVSDSLAGVQQGPGVVGFDLQIDEARDQLQRYEYDLARLSCEKLRRNSWDRLNARQRFRTLSNLATANLRLDNVTDAARLFIEAKEFQPDDPIALANEAFAHYLLEDSDQAFKLATHAKDCFPNSAQALVAWMNAAPLSLPLKYLEEAIPPQLLVDAEVVMTLARRALMEKDNVKAEALARRATTLKVDWSYPWAVLGESIFRSALPDTAEDYVRAGSSCDKSRLTAADEACTKAIDLSRKEKQHRLQAGALLIRAEVRRLLGDLAGGEDDVNTAWSIQPDDPSVVRDYVRLKLQHGQKEDAIAKLRAALKHNDRHDVRMLLALALSSTGDTGDRIEGTQVFMSLATDPEVGDSGFRTEAVMGALDNLVRDQRWEEGRSVFIKLPPNSVSPIAVSALKGGLELAAGDREKASEFATEAMAAVTTTTGRDSLRLVRTSSEDLGQAGA